MSLLRNTSWDALQAFAEFAEHRNFTRAAARLHLSQPALHTKIANLGNALGVTLYVRRGRQIEITDAGRKVQRFARELGQAADTFESELHEREGTQPVVLSAGEGSYLYILGAGIRAYRASSRHPLRLETADGTAAVDAVSSARAHLGVASLEAPPGGLTVQPLTRVGQVLAMPTRHPLAARRAIRLQHLEGADLIVPPMGRPHRTILSQMLQSARVQWRVAVEASGWELMLKFVQMGLGLAVVNACCRLPKGVVARPLPELPSLQYFIFHSSRSLPKPAMELKESLVRLGDSWREQRR